MHWTNIHNLRSSAISSHLVICKQDHSYTKLWSNRCMQANMDTMVADLTKVMNASASGTGKLKFSSFLPTSIKTLEYFTYDGSLTTPPCSQAVKWTVLAETQPVNDKQVYLNTF